MRHYPWYFLNISNLRWDLYFHYHGRIQTRMILWYRCLNRLPQNHHQVDHRGDKGSSLLGSEKLMCKYICIRLVSNQSFTFSLCSISFYYCNQNVLSMKLSFTFGHQRNFFLFLYFLSVMLTYKVIFWQMTLISFGFLCRGFGEWERHTRGVGKKLLEKVILYSISGYRYLCYIDTVCKGKPNMIDMRKELLF